MMIDSNIKNLPDAPGCYILKDIDGVVLYVGKAVNLRARVRTYFNTNVKLETSIGFPFLNNTNEKVQKLSMLAKSLEYTETPNEAEVLLLEHRLIKEHKPPFNSHMNKVRPSFYICIDTERARPGITMAVEPEAVKFCVKFYGALFEMEDTLAAIGNAWKVPTCKKKHFDEMPGRACLRHSMAQCAAPCLPATDETAYREAIEQLCAFLSEQGEAALDFLVREMNEAAGNLDFERAAALRNQYENLQKIHKRVHVTRKEAGLKRICVLLKGFNDERFVLFYIENGEVLLTYRFENAEGWESGRDLFIKRVNEKDFDLPPEHSPFAAIFEINARKSYVDASKKLTAAVMDKAMKALFKPKRG